MSHYRCTEWFELMTEIHGALTYRLPSSRSSTDTYAIILGSITTKCERCSDIPGDIEEHCCADTEISCKGAHEQGFPIGPLGIILQGVWPNQNEFTEFAETQVISGAVAYPFDGNTTPFYTKPIKIPADGGLIGLSTVIGPGLTPEWVGCCSSFVSIGTEPHALWDFRCRDCSGLPINVYIPQDATCCKYSSLYSPSDRYPEHLIPEEWGTRPDNDYTEHLSESPASILLRIATKSDIYHLTTETGGIGPVRATNGPVIINGGVEPKDEIDIHTCCDEDCLECLLDAMRKTESSDNCTEGVPIVNKCDGVGCNKTLPNGKKVPCGNDPVCCAACGCGPPFDTAKKEKCWSCGPYQIKKDYWDDARWACSVEPKCCELNNYDWSQLCDGSLSCEEQKRISKLAIQCWMRRYTRNGNCQCTGSCHEPGCGPNTSCPDRCFSCEDLARMHNGGPCGHNSSGTDSYINGPNGVCAHLCDAGPACAACLDCECNGNGDPISKERSMSPPSSVPKIISPTQRSTPPRTSVPKPSPPMTKPPTSGGY